MPVLTYREPRMTAHRASHKSNEHVTAVHPRLGGNRTRGGRGPVTGHTGVERITVAFIGHGAVAAGDG